MKIRGIFVFAVLALLSSGLPAQAAGNPDQGRLLPKVKDASFARFVLYSKIIATHKSNSDFVRIVGFWRGSECDANPPKSCPKERLWVGVGEFGEYPDYALFDLGESYGWEFLSWVDDPMDAQDTIFRLRKTLIVPYKGKGISGEPYATATKDYEVRVDTKRATIREVTEAKK